VNGEEFKQWLRDGAPLECEKTPALDTSSIEAFRKVGHFDAELLGDFPLRDDAGDDVIATMTPNGLEIEVVERVPVGMREKDRRRALRKFKISREKLANMTKAQAEAFFVGKLEEMGVRPEMARNLVKTRLTFADMPKSPIRGRQATTVIVDDPLKALEVTAVQITPDPATGKVTVDAQTNRGMKRVEIDDADILDSMGPTLFDRVRDIVTKKIDAKQQENVRKWYEDNDGAKPYPTKDGKTVEPEGQRVLGIDFANGPDKTAAAVFRKRSDGTVVLEDFKTFDD
jgi:hypothetical protein